jgi:beta-lactamase superfamily II metal-dependent hydrolase
MRLKVFPASEGDCFLLSLNAQRHILIDGGRERTYASLKPELEAIHKRGASLDLLVLSHIDADHIAGMLKYVEDEAPPIKPGEVWFNGFEQLEGIERYGEKQGDDYTKALKANGWPINEKFEGGAIFLEDEPLAIERSGFKLTLLSPDREKLKKMYSKWQKWRESNPVGTVKDLPDGVEQFGHQPIRLPLNVETLSKPTPTDPKANNGSSIAFIAEWEGKKILFAADAHPGLLEASLAKLPQADRQFDLVKLSHHGSHANTTKGLLEKIECSKFLVSTNGAHHGHPDPQAIARILKFIDGKKTIYFNYRTARTSPWDNKDLKEKFDYETVYGADNEIMVIDL